MQKEAYADLEKALKEPSAMMAPYVKQGGIGPSMNAFGDRQWGAQQMHAKARSNNNNQLLTHGPSRMNSLTWEAFQLKSDWITLW